jgi:TRAP-type C4-dicarboxylate transport system substrate-binding protein
MKPRILPGMAWVVAAAILAAGAAACGTGRLDKAGGPVSKPVVLTLVDGESDTSNAQPFADAVSSLSHGALQIKIESDWRPNDPAYASDLITDVQAGKAQLGITPSRSFDIVGINSFQALQAPFLIDNYPLEQKVLASSIPGAMLQGLEAHGLVGLAVLPGPLRRPFGFTRPLIAASSYRGARIGIGPSEVTADILRALGAIPVTQARSNSGMNTSGLTGIEAHTATDFVLPHEVLTGNVVLEPRPNVVFINQHAFGLLTASQRDVLSRAAALARTAGVYQGNDVAFMADLCRRGIKVVSASPAELAGLLAAVQPVYQALESNPATRAYIDEITAMRQAEGGSPDVVACPSVSSRGVAVTASRLQGTWQVTFTESELAAAGADSGELVPSEGNWGHFTLTLQQGHWSMRLLGGDPAAAPNNLHYFGTYVVTGQQINFYRHDQSYTGSNTEVWGPYIWSVYRDTLTFKKYGWTGGIQGPTSLIVKPWRTTGT